MKKPYRVTAYHYYGIAQINRHHFDFRWYWQANVVSFLLHHLLGYSCNTWKYTPGESPNLGERNEERQD